MVYKKEMVRLYDDQGSLDGDRVSLYGDQVSLHGGRVSIVVVSFFSGDSFLFIW